ncbi:probable E3 ubiquitin-protein ligase makorin-1 isoform X1 [Chiloscyllium plagiosum]|uniref:probable E3 ubiquitin-protein ligase makorin-1 isoform X1 n=2 Tax=Chiloscyllium plagiosum TaxID=36176 RepID=UPI001CB7CF56|nr:probable E3 ubiquitin-protein ligase makorin-1 isoform X1 [Chiloscyllium plagiosum]
MAEAAASMGTAAAAVTVTLAGGGGGGGSGGVGWTKQVTCRYFMHGVCKEGNNCRYSHDLTTSKPSLICKYFQKGCCTYGDRCRYDHVKPSNQGLSEVQSGPTPLISKDSATASASKLTPLTKLNGEMSTKTVIEESNSATSSNLEDWVNAAEFIPGQPYCGRTTSTYPETRNEDLIIEENFEGSQTEDVKKQMCPYAALGECRYGVNCVYLHGDVCDMCGLQVLHPVDASQRSDHIKACIEAHEKDMELSFAIQRSKDIICGICMEVIYEKTNASERRFGILSNCSHTYCLNCIRKWRSAKQFENKIVKSCPECRITSNFVIPSEYWVEDKEEKQKLIKKYKEAMSNKACRYFDQGRGTCPFGSNCFYKHAYPDGRLEEPQPPRKPVASMGRYRNQRRTHFWNFIEERENTDSYENDEMVTFELGEVLLMLLADGHDDDFSDTDDEWDLFHDEMDVDYYEFDL